MKQIFYTFATLVAVILLSACHHDSLADRAEKEVKDYTERYCPTPMTNEQRTDSITFTRATNTINYYYTLGGRADNVEVFQKFKPKLTKIVLQQLKDDTHIRAYKQAGFSFHYVFRSLSTGDVLLEKTFTKRQYLK